MEGLELVRLSPLCIHSSIRTVDATENELSLLPPPYAWKSCGLKDLRVSGNAITQLDLNECGRFWPHLESLYIGQNKIKEVSVPEEVSV